MISLGLKRGRRFPAGDLDRVVPCADAHADAERLAARIDERVLAQRNLAAFERGGEPGVILDDVGAGHDIHRARFGDRLARIAHLQLSEFIVARAQ